MGPWDEEQTVMAVEYAGIMPHGQRTDKGQAIVIKISES